MQDKAEALISCEKDYDRWTVLYRRYMLNQKWEEIAMQIITKIKRTLYAPR